MKTSVINALAILLILLFTSCNSEKKKETQVDESQMEAMGDNSMTSLDWGGTYEGELPCEDCEGIKTIITINKDNTYVMKETYLGKNTPPYESKGIFEWDDEGQRIMMSDTKRHPYFIGENTMTHLDKDGNKISGALESLYVLNKVKDKLVGEKWHLVAFRGEEIQLEEAKAERPSLEFNEDFTLLGYTGCNNLQGVYEIGAVQKIKFSQLINTLKACPEMETENEFLKTINSAVSYGFEEHALVMFDKNHQKLATFKAAN